MQYSSLIGLFFVSSMLLGCSSQKIVLEEFGENGNIAGLESFQHNFDQCISDPKSCSDLPRESSLTGKVATLYGSNGEVLLFNRSGDADDEGLQILLTDNKKNKIVTTTALHEVVDGSTYLEEGMDMSFHMKSFHKEENGLVVEKYGQFSWIQIQE